MKKALSTYCLTILICASSFCPLHAHATASFFDKKSELAWTGAKLFGGSVVVHFVLEYIAKNAGPASLLVLLPSLPVLFVTYISGITLLDQPGMVSGFQELTPATQKRLGISESDAEIYNSEIPMLNAVAETIQEELSRFELFDKDPHKKLRAVNEKAYQLWNEYSSHFASETLRVLNRITARQAPGGV